MAKKIQASQLDALKTSGQTLSESLADHGSLIARRMSGATKWYYQYRYDGKQRRYSFGAYKATGDGKGSEDATEFTLGGARKRAQALAALREQVGDVIEHMSEKRLAASESVQQARDARQERQQATRDYSLANLCKAYSDHLVADGKASASTVRGSLTNWVVNRHPKLAAKKASDVTTADVMTILRTIIDAGHKTTVNRVRSYLSAAYSFGLGSVNDPVASSRAGGFNLTSNPAAPVKRVAKFESAGERVLSAGELGDLLRRLEAKPTPAAQAVELSLRLGGQRLTQLLAVTAKDYDRDSCTVTIKDTKGRRTEARAHLLPVFDVVAPLLEQALSEPHPRRSGLFSGMAMDTASKAVRDISKELEQGGAEPYSWRDLRRTCETMLAAMGISKDIRAQLQSHGLSGVQDRHYDKHQYIDEKRAALEAWNDRLDELKAGTTQPGNVVRLIR